MEYLVYVAVFLSVILSGVAILAVSVSNKALKLILAFSGAYLFAISVLHLIPEIYSSGNDSIGIYILAGFFAQILLEFFSEGIEHGHIHVHGHHERAFPATMMIALSIHSFMEGMPLAKTFENPSSKQLLVGIILHNIPIAMALMTMLLQSDIKKAAAFFWLVVFALMTPFGILAGEFIGSGAADLAQYSNIIMAIVVGIFLHISTTILFESSEHHRFNLIKFVTILIGAAIAMLSF